jgi:hypothetical protein
MTQREEELDKLVKSITNVNISLSGENVRLVNKILNFRDKLMTIVQIDSMLGEELLKQYDKDFELEINQ